MTTISKLMSIQTVTETIEHFVRDAKTSRDIISPKEADADHEK